MVKSADRVLLILELIARMKGGLKHIQIANSLKIPPSSLSKLLATLVANEYLAFDKEDKRYRLGPQILMLSTRYLADLDVVRFAQPIIDDLAYRTGESASLAIKKGAEAMFVCKQESSQAIISRLGLGERVPLYATAVGKVLLAYLPEEEIDQFFSSVEMTPLTKFTITDPRELLQEFNLIRKKNIAYSREEQIEGLFAIAAPVFDLASRVVAGITVVTPKVRFNRKKEALIRNMIMESATTLSQSLGFDKVTIRSKQNKISNA